MRDANASETRAQIDTEKVEIGLTDANSSCLIRSPGGTTARYVAMPMRL